MPYDPLQLKVDVDALTAHPSWSDEASRRDFIRQVGIDAKPNLDAESHKQLMESLWGKAEPNTLSKAGKFVGTAVEETAKSIPAAGGAAVFAAMDALGITDTGSGTRLAQGVKGFVDTAGQRIKQFDPNDRQEQRDALLESLREDLDTGASPPGFEKWLSGEYDSKDIDDPDTKAYVDALVSSISRAGVAADRMGDIDQERLNAFMQSDRNPARADSDIPEEAGARQYLADYVATKDPQSWDAFKSRVTETDQQYESRVRRYAAQKPEAEGTLKAMPEGLGKEMAARSFSMQESPIDLASAMLPALRGAKALQAARAGGVASAFRGAGLGALKEGGQEAGTEYLQDPRATGAQIAEAGAMGAVGSGVIEGGMAGAGALMRPQVLAVPATPEEAATQTIEGDTMVDFVPRDAEEAALKKVTLEVLNAPPEPDARAPIQERVDQVAAASVAATAELLPATAAALQATPPKPTEGPAKEASDKLNALAAIRPPATTTRIEAKPTVMNGRGVVDVRVAPVQKETPVGALEAEASGVLLPEDAVVEDQSQNEPTPSVEETLPPVEPIPAVEEAPAPYNMEQARRQWIDEERTRNPSFAPDVESWLELQTPEDQTDYQEFEALRYKSVAGQGPEKGYRPYKLSAKEKTRLQYLASKFLPRLKAEVTDTRAVEEAPAPATVEESVQKTENVVAPAGDTEVGVGMEVPLKVGNTGAVPTAEEQARWEAVDAYTTPIIKSKTGDELDALGDAVGVRRRGVGDAAYQDKILANTHPDDLLDAINPPPPTQAVAEKGTVGTPEKKRPMNMAGQVRPEKKSRALPKFTPTPKEPFKPSAERFTQFYVDDGFPEATAAKNGAKLMHVVETGEWSDILRPDNVKSRTIWEAWTRQKLPKGLAASKTAVAEFLAEYRAKTFTTPATELSDAELGAEILRVAEYGMKPASSQTLKDRSLELSKEFQSRQKEALPPVGQTQGEGGSVSRELRQGGRSLPLPVQKNTPEVEKSSGQRDTSKPEQMTPEEAVTELSPADENGWRQDVVATVGDYKISVNDREGATSASVWKGDKKIGYLTPLHSSIKTPEGWLGIHKAWIDKEHRAKGLGTEMYRALASHLGEADNGKPYEGIYSQPLADAANNFSRHNDSEIPAIYKKLGGHFDSDGEGFLPRINVPTVVKSSLVPTKPKVSKNTLITDERAAELKKSLKRKTTLGGQTNMLLDLSAMADAVLLGAYYVEKGARTFAAFSKAMLDDIGPQIRENLQDIYNAVREKHNFEGMDGVAPVDNKKSEETAPDNKTTPPVTKTEDKEPTKATPAPETKASEPPPQPPAKTAAPTTLLEGPVSIVNAQLNQVAEILGLPQLETPLDGPYKWEKAWEDARVEMEQNPQRGSELVSEMLSRPREVSPVEVPILLREAVVRTNAYNAAVEAQTKAPASEQESANQRVSDAINALADVQQASAVMGTFSGRALNFRKMSAWMDFSLANMVLRLKGNKQADLTPEEMKEAQATHKKITDTEAEIAKTKASAGAEAELTSVFDETFKEAMALTKKTANDLIAQSRIAAKKGTTMKDFLREKREEARKRIRQRGGSLNMGLNPADLFDHAVIMASYIAEGVVSLADLTAKMIGDFGQGVEKHIPQIKKEADALLEAEQSVFEKPEEGTTKSYADQLVESQGESLSDRWVYNRVKEWLVEQGEAGLKRDSKELLDEVFEVITKEVNKFDPSITEQQLRDMFSGYGKVKFPDPEAAAKKLRQMRRLELLFDKLERARAGVAPLRAGLQRDETTPDEREALRLLNQTMKDLDIPHAPSGANIKTPLDAVKSRLKNRIEDLNKQIKDVKEGRGRTERPRKDVEYDDDAKKLEADRDALQEELDELSPPRPPTTQERIAARLKDLDNQIAELERRVKAKDFAPEQNKTPITEQLQVKMDERDALTKTLKELRIQEEGLPVRTQEQVNEAAQASLTRQIDTLEEQIQKQDFAPKEGLKPEMSPQLFRLKAQIEALRKQRDQLKKDLGFRKKQKTHDELIDAAVASLEKSIDGLSKQINEGDLTSKTRPSKTPEVAKVKNLRAERDSLREEVQRLRKAKEDAAKDPVAEKIKADRKQLQRMIQSYETRIKEGNFRKRPKIAKHYDDSLMQLEIDLDNIKAEWSRKVFEAHLASRPKLKQMLDAGGQVLNTSRAILTSMDLSAVLRQGGFIGLGNPIRAARNIGPMLRAFTSDDVAKASLKRLKQRDNWRNYVTAGLYIAETDQTKMSAQEEAFMSRWIDKIPGGAKGLFIGSLVRGSQRAYLTFLNNLRADTFDSLLNQLQKGPTPTREEMESLARYINTATGRGDLGSWSQAAVKLNTIFFAPRLVVSRFQIIGGMPIFKATGRTKALVLQEYAKFIMGAAIVYALAGMAQDDDDKPLEFDPRSSDFLKIRYGDTRVDPLGGLIQATVFVSRIVAGEKKASSGKIVPIRDTFRLPNLFRDVAKTDKVPYGGSNVFDVGSDFMRTKFSPAFGGAVDLVTGENVIGETVTPADVAYKMIIPMSFNDAAEVIEEHGMPKGPALTTLMIFGAGVMTYNNQKK